METTWAFRATPFLFLGMFVNTVVHLLSLYIYYHYLLKCTFCFTDWFLRHMCMENIKGHLFKAIKDYQHEPTIRTLAPSKLSTVNCWFKPCGSMFLSAAIFEIKPSKAFFGTPGDKGALHC